MSDWLDSLLEHASPAWLAACVVVNLALAVALALKFFW